MSDPTRTASDSYEGCGFDTAHEGHDSDCAFGTCESSDERARHSPLSTGGHITPTCDTSFRTLPSSSNLGYEPGYGLESCVSERSGYHSSALPHDSIVYFDALEEVENRSAFEIFEWMDTYQILDHSLRELIAVVVILGSAGYCVARADVVTQSMQLVPFLLSSWFSCLLTSPPRSKLRRTILVVGSWLLSIGTWLHDGRPSGYLLSPAHQRFGYSFRLSVPWVGMGLSLFTPVNLLCGVGGRVGSHGLLVGFSVSVFLIGFLTGSRCSNDDDGHDRFYEIWFIAAVQALGASILPLGEDVQRACSNSPAATVTLRTSQFWALAAVAACVTLPARCLAGTELYLDEASSYSSAFTVLSPAVCGLFGITTSFHEPQMLQFLCGALGFGIFALRNWEERVDEPLILSRRFLFSLCISIASFHMASVACCFGGRYWFFVVLANIMLMAIADHWMEKHDNVYWASGVLAPLLATVLCSKCLLIRRPHSFRMSPSYPALQASSKTRRSLRTTRRLSSDPEPPRPSLAQSFTSRLHGLVNQPWSATTLGDPSVLNRLVRDLWPTIRAYIETDVLKGELEPLLKREVTGALRFDHVSLGVQPPLVHAFWITPPMLQKDAITMAADFEFIGQEMDIALKFGLQALAEITVSIARISVHGTLYMSLRHPTSEWPLISGMNVFFVNSPSVEVELSSPFGATDLLPKHALEQLSALITQALARLMVLPNRIAVPFGERPLSDFMHSIPEGVLVCNASSAQSQAFTSASSDIYVELQVGSQSWCSSVASCVGGCATWNEIATLIVDHRANQQLLITLHEKHTLGDSRLTDCYGLSMLELLRKSMKRDAPSWTLPSLKARRGSPNFTLSARWHRLSSDPDTFLSDFGSLLLINVESVHNIPPQNGDLPFVVVAYLVDSSTELTRLTKPVAETCPMRISDSRPQERSRNLVGQIMQYFSRDAIGMDNQSKSACSSTVPLELEEQRRRLQYIWNNFRMADGTSFAELAHRSRHSCKTTLTHILGSQPQESFVENFIDKALMHSVSSAQNGGAPVADLMENSSGSAAVFPLQLEGAGSCHWNQQLRVVTKRPQQEDLVLHLCVERRSNRRVVHTWRKSLDEILSTPGLVCDLSATSIENATSNRNGPTDLFLDAQVQVLHIMPPDGVPVAEAQVNPHNSATGAAPVRRHSSRMASAVKSLFRRRSSASVNIVAQEQSLA